MIKKMENAPVENAPVENGPVENASVENAPVENEVRVTLTQCSLYNWISKNKVGFYILHKSVKLVLPSRFIL